VERQKTQELFHQSQLMLGEKITDGLLGLFDLHALISVPRLVHVEPARFNELRIQLRLQSWLGT
jgi:hypothetical protein